MSSLNSAKVSLSKGTDGALHRIDLIAPFPKIATKLPSKLAVSLYVLGLT